MAEHDNRGEQHTATDAPRRVVAHALSSLVRELTESPALAVGETWEGWLRPGACIGRYELVREIGRGGFGVVWEARDRDDDGRLVAFKAVRAGQVAKDREERLVREAELAARLSHPSIVTLLDAGRSEHGPYLVTELLRGATLADRLARGRIPPREGVRIGLQIAQAAAHAHTHGVVHRDLKPGNIFLCEDGKTKVLDFGLAHAFGQRKAAGGTPGYMAPEQWRDAPEDERTDVFGLGVILFRMLADELPFPGDEGARVLPTRPAFALEIADAPALGALVTRMLENDPVERPRDAVEVLSALVAIDQELERASREGAAPPQVSLRRTPAAEVRAREYYERGRQFLRQTRKTSLRFARDMFARAIELDPRYARARAGLAEAVALMHMYYPPDESELAVADRESAHALRQRPDLAEAHAARGLSLFLLKRFEESRAQLECAIAIDPRLFEAHYYAARACFQQGQLEDSLVFFRAATKVREDYQASFFVGQALEALGKSEEAVTAYQEALAVAERHMDLNPDDPRAATMRAVSLCRVGQQTEGLRWAQQALVLDPQDAGVRYNVACLYALEGALDEALSCLEEVVRAGFGNKAWIEKDPDLASLRGHPRFQRLMAKM